MKTVPPVYEDAVQALWAEQNFGHLKTIEGDLVQVHFPGWLNTAGGADFQEARIQIAAHEYQGSVEIHLQSSSWYAHKHHLNPVYNSVVLHVVLYDSSSAKKIIREDGKTIPEIVLSQAISNSTQILKDTTAQQRLSLYKNLPGRCGVLLENSVHESGLKNLVEHAAEQRIQTKVEMLLQAWDSQETEELLFQLLFKSMGYSAYAQAFEELAKLHPFQNLRPLLLQSQRLPRVSVLGRWMGSCDLLPAQLSDLPSLKDPTLRKEVHQWRSEWNALQHKPKVAKRLSVSRRPQNSPERRLIGMFHHLHRVAPEGLLLSWLKVLKTLEGFASEKTLKQQALEHTQKLFETPAWEVWQSQWNLSSASSSKPTQLLGRNRQMVIWANALIPFFLAYARKQQDSALETLLYRLFMVLPPEASNTRTRFMEERLALKSSSLKLRNFGHKQGLLQIHNDFCRNFYQGCAQCELVPLLESSTS